MLRLLLAVRACPIPQDVAQKEVQGEPHDDAVNEVVSGNLITLMKV